MILKITNKLFFLLSSTSFALDFTVSLNGQPFSLGGLPDLDVDTILAELPAPADGGTFSITIIAVASSLAITTVEASVSTFSFDLAFAVAFDVEIQADLFTSLEFRLKSQFEDEYSSGKYTLLFVLSQLGVIALLTEAIMSKYFYFV